MTRPGTTEIAARGVVGGAPVFGSIVCGVGPGEASLEAARQAAMLATGGDLSLVAIEPAGAEAASRRQLAAARDITRVHGLDPTVTEVRADAVTPALLLLAAHHDLLVVGAHRADEGHPDTARAAVHQAPVPVMVARAPRAGAEVTDRLLIAIDGSPEAHDAMTVAGALARRHAAEVAVVAPLPGHSEHPAVLAADLAEARVFTHRPAVLDGDDGAEAIVRAARAVDATLVVMGSRGLSGIAALSSVSEHVAHEAHCSVLVVRPRAA
jgi:nucleotide-binding universal stress UspA family protein